MKFLLSIFILIATGNISAKEPHALNIISTISNLPDPSDHQIVANMLDVGKWMLDANGNIAHWLGQKYENRQLNEPINVILCVQTQSSADAEKSLTESMSKAGFKLKRGHSTGYQALIDNSKYEQFSSQIDGTLSDKEFPRKKEYTFSNASFLSTNNHGRVFGPVFQNNQYCYTGAFSIETFRLTRHDYVSFTKARELLAETLVQKAEASELGYTPLNNAIPEENSNLTTGDHDGNAIMIELPNNY